MKSINIAKTSPKLFVSIVIVYLLLSASHVVESGLFRFFPTLILILILFCGMASWAENQMSRMKTLISLFCFYAVLSSLLCPTTGGTVTTLLKSTYWCWIYFISAIIFRNKEINEVHYGKLVLGLTIVFALLFFMHHSTSTFESELEGDNFVFFVLLMIPWICLVPQNTKHWIALIIITLCSLVSLKRSAIIISLSSVAFLYVRDFLMRKRLSATSLFGAGLIILLAIGIIYTQSDTVNKVSQRFEQIEDDGGNGRDVIYADVINRYESGTSAQKIFGRGFDSVRHESTFFVPVSAHNDFLEVLYDFGIIGIVIYVLIHISLIKWTIHLLRQRSPLGFPVMISYVCFIVMSMVSHLVLYPTYFAILVSFWAFAECKNRQLGYGN